MSTTCEHFKKSVVLTAEIHVKDSPEAIVRFRRAILNVRASSLSSAEPGALEYRLSQAYNVFSVWAKFADAQSVMLWVQWSFTQAFISSIVSHTRTQAYWDMHMLDELLLSGPNVLFYEEL